ncbi:MAG: hypothetical protein WCT37_00030 [Patescibacteria group bacterium]|jgi:uncharacterized membrane protein
MAVKKKPVTASSSTQNGVKDIEENKVVAALSYIWILFLIPLLAKKDSPFCQWHAKQGLVLFLVEVVGSLVFWIPLFGWLLLLGVILLAVVGILRALIGEFWEMPILGAYAKKINL